MFFSALSHHFEGHFEDTGPRPRVPFGEAPFCLESGPGKRHQVLWARKPIGMANQKSWHTAVVGSPAAFAKNKKSKAMGP